MSTVTMIVMIQKVCVCACVYMCIYVFLTLKVNFWYNLARFYPEGIYKLVEN